MASPYKLWADDRVNDKIGARLSTLKRGNRPGTVEHPFPLVDKDEYKRRIKRSGIAAATHTTPLTEVPLSKLHGHQQTVNVERLEEHALDPDLIAKGTLASGHGALVDAPIIADIDGKLVIHDGHHRATAAYLRGDRTIIGRVIKVPAKES